jgi:transposase
MAKTIDYTPSDREKYELVTDLLGLEELDVVDQRYDRANRLHELYCAAQWEMALCPKCLQLSNRIHDYPKQRRIHDAPLRGEKVLLIFDSRRFDCEHCKQPFTQEIADVVPDCTYTYRLYEEITNPKRKQDVATMAELYGIGYKIVERMLLNAGEAKLAERRNEPLQVTRLGIDEIAQKKDTVISSSS